MKKEMQGKTIVIEGTSFKINIEQQALIEQDDPENTISFVTQMKDCGDHYEMEYNRRLKNTQDTADTENVVTIEVPTLIELDPEGMAARYDLTIGDLKNKTDFEVIVDQHLWQQRQSGVLPTIDIAGEHFVIDLRLQEFRHAQNFTPIISLRSLDLDSKGDHYMAFYHPFLRQVVNIDPKLTEFPEGVVAIKMPNELGLDPIAAARKYRIDEKVLARLYPMQKELKADIVPLSETGIPALIQKNRQALRSEHEQIRSNRKFKRGRGL